jgi:hypothetical protein
VADRRGDVLLAQGKKDEARTAFQAAWAAMDEKLDYRRLVEAKLTSLGGGAGRPAPSGGFGGRPVSPGTRLAGCRWALILLAACSFGRQAQAHAAGGLHAQASPAAWSGRPASVGIGLPLASWPDPHRARRQFIAGSATAPCWRCTAETGAELWRARRRADLTAGVGSDGRFASRGHA